MKLVQRVHKKLQLFRHLKPDRKGENTEEGRGRMKEACVPVVLGRALLNRCFPTLKSAASEAPPCHLNSETGVIGIKSLLA